MVPEFISQSENSTIRFFNCDCMDYLKSIGDKEINLCIVDPPYGIGISGNSFRQKHKKLSWDNAIPTDEYFTELKRVSKNQVIWGGNYFDLPPSQGFLIWDKVQPFDFSSAMCELAWMSFQKPAKIFKKHVVTTETNKIHPTQKPVQLYRWLLQNYAKKDDKILDTHGGSMSIAIACDMEGFDLDVCEIDTDYFKAGVNRFNEYKRQLTLF